MEEGDAGKSAKSDGSGATYVRDYEQLITKHGIIKQPVV